MLISKVGTWQNMVDEWQIIKMVRSQEMKPSPMGWVDPERFLKRKS